MKLIKAPKPKPKRAKNLLLFCPQLRSQFFLWSLVDRSMAAVQPRVAPRRHPPPPAVPPLPAAPSSQAPAARPQLPCKRSRADAVAVAHGRNKERVAESCCPSSSRLEQLELVLVDDDSGEEDDGCGSCVDGAGGAGGGQDDEEEESGSRGVAWWSQESGGGGRRCSLWTNGSRATEGGQLRAGGEHDDEDPTVAAARRQEDDRKFWEACLASGYPWTLQDVQIDRPIDQWPGHACARSRSCFLITSASGLVYLIDATRRSLCFGQRYKLVRGRVCVWRVKCKSWNKDGWPNSCAELTYW